MAHWAQVSEGNIVTKVLVAGDDSHDWLVETFGGKWIQTSYNTKGGVHYDAETGEPSADQSKALRFNFAGPGFAYDEARDAFIPPYPNDGLNWELNEDTLLWEEIIG